MIIEKFRWRIKPNESPRFLEEVGANVDQDVVLALSVNLSMNMVKKTLDLPGRTCNRRAPPTFWWYNRPCNEDASDIIGLQGSMMDNLAPESMPKPPKRSIRGLQHAATMHLHHIDHAGKSSWGSVSSDHRSYFATAGGYRK